MLCAAPASLPPRSSPNYHPILAGESEESSLSRSGSISSSSSISGRSRSSSLSSSFKAPSALPTTSLASAAGAAYAGVGGGTGTTTGGRWIAVARTLSTGSRDSGNFETSGSLSELSSSFPSLSNQLLPPTLPQKKVRQNSAGDPAGNCRSHVRA